MTAGPAEVVSTGLPSAVWLTAESLGARDPALASHPDLPVVFVFDEPLLASLQLSSKRLVFLTETLAEIAAERDLELWLGDPVDVLQGTAARRHVRAGARLPRRADRLQLVEVHPVAVAPSPDVGADRIVQRLAPVARAR